MMTGSTVGITEAAQRISQDDLRAVALRESLQFTPDTRTLLPNWLQSRLLLVGASAIASLSVHAMAGPSVAAADTCTTTTTVESTTTVCGPDQPGAATPDSSPVPDDSEPESPTKPQKSKKAGPKLRKHVSYDMCAWGSDRICGSGCGDVVSADAITDLTGQSVTPIDMLSVLSPDYYIPGSGTRPEAFAVIARRWHLNESASNLSGAKRTITKKGGLAIAEFNADLADRRSGSSPIAVNDHYVVLDRFRNGKFAIADPHQGKDRHTETNPGGSIHWWSVQALNAAGLTHVWTLSRAQ